MTRYAILWSFAIAAGTLAMLAIAQLPRLAGFGQAHSGTDIATAVGTQFNVKRELGRVTVTVSEGSVLVAPNAANMGRSASIGTPSISHPVLLEQGQSFTYNGSDPAPRAH